MPDWYGIPISLLACLLWFLLCQSANCIAHYVGYEWPWVRAERERRRRETKRDIEEAVAAVLQRRLPWAEEALVREKVMSRVAEERHGVEVSLLHQKLGTMRKRNPS